MGVEEIREAICSSVEPLDRLTLVAECRKRRPGSYRTAAAADARKHDNIVAELSHTGSIVVLREHHGRALRSLFGQCMEMESNPRRLHPAPERDRSTPH